MIVFDSGTCHANFKNTSVRVRHILFVNRCPADAACIARDKYCAPRSVEDNGRMPADYLISDVRKRLCGLVPYADEENEK